LTCRSIRCQPSHPSATSSSVTATRPQLTSPALGRRRVPTSCRWRPLPSLSPLHPGGDTDQGAISLLSTRIGLAGVFFWTVWITAKFQTAPCPPCRNGAAFAIRGVLVDRGVWAGQRPATPQQAARRPRKLRGTRRPPGGSGPTSPGPGGSSA
jgi:hypothetical protein